MKPSSKIEIGVSDAPANLKSTVRRVASYALSSQGVRRATLSIAFVTLPRMRKLHAEWFGDDSPTDVITFDLGAEKNGRSRTLDGEIIICPAVAKKQAATFDVSLREELLRYVVHGCLHLCGYDDRRPTDAKAMHAEQERVLTLFLRTHQ